MWTLTIVGEGSNVPTHLTEANALTRLKDVHIRRIVEELAHAGSNPTGASLEVTYVNLADEASFDEDLYGTAPAT